MKIMVTLEIEQADEEEVRIYLNYVKKQMEKYTNIKMSGITVLKNQSDVDNEVRKYLEIAKRLDCNKKAPSAKGAITKLTPKL